MNQISFQASIILMATLLCSFGFSSNGQSSSQNSLKNNQILEDGSPVIDHWFFVVPSHNKQKGFEKRRQVMVVHTGEDFGVGVRFLSKKPTIKMQIKLVVPSSPENFPCPTCKPGELSISKDDNTITLNRDVPGAKAQSAFYWGIDGKDPRGKYQMSLSVDGVQIEAYDFEVK